MFQINLGVGQSLSASTRWSSDDRMGMEFAKPFDLEKPGQNELMKSADTGFSNYRILRKAG